MDRVLVSSKRLDFCTPVDFLREVRKVSPIILDPAGNRRSRVEAKHTFYPPRGWKKRPSLVAGGLSVDWVGIARKGLVYVNPPYGRHVKVWAQKMIAEASAGAHILALVASRTDTIWFQAMVTAKPRPIVILIRGRLTYIGETNPATFPNAIIYYGPNEQKRRRFLRVFGETGLRVKLL